MRGEVANMLENRLNGTLRQYELNPDIRRSWDIMQHDVSSLNDLYTLQSYIFKSLFIAIRENIIINIIVRKEFFYWSINIILILL